MYARGYVTRPGAYELDPSMPLGTAPSQTPVGQTILRCLQRLRPRPVGPHPHRPGGGACRARGGPHRACARRRRLPARGPRRPAPGRAAVPRPPARPFLAPDDLGRARADRRCPSSWASPTPLERDDVPLTPTCKRLLRAGKLARWCAPQGPRPPPPTAAWRSPSSQSAATDAWDVMAWAKVALGPGPARAGIAVPPCAGCSPDRRAARPRCRPLRPHPGRCPRIGYVSAMTMLRGRATAATRSYLEIAEAVEERPARAGRDLRKLWRRLLFNVLDQQHRRPPAQPRLLHAGGRRGPSLRRSTSNPQPDPGPSSCLRSSTPRTAPQPLPSRCR